MKGLAEAGNESVFKRGLEMGSPSGNGDKLKTNWEIVALFTVMQGFIIYREAVIRRFSYCV